MSVDLNEPRIKLLVHVLGKYCPNSTTLQNHWRQRGRWRPMFSAAAIALDMPPGQYEFSEAECEFVVDHLRVQGVWST